MVCGETNDKHCCCFFGDAQQTSVRITRGTPSCRGHIPQWHRTPSCKHNCTMASSRSSRFSLQGASRLTHLHSACAFQPQPQPTGHSADSSLAGLSRENVSSDHFDFFWGSKSTRRLGQQEGALRPELSHSHDKRAAAWRYWALRPVGPKIASRAFVALEATTRYDHGFLCNQLFVVAKGESVDPFVDQESCKVAAPLEERPAELKVGTRSCRDGPRSKIDCLK